MKLETYLMIKEAGNPVNKELLRNYKILNNVPNQKGIPYPLARAGIEYMNPSDQAGLAAVWAMGKTDHRAQTAAWQHIMNTTLDPSSHMTRKMHKAMNASPGAAADAIETYFQTRNDQLRKPIDDTIDGNDTPYRFFKRITRGLNQRRDVAQSAMQKAPNLVSATRDKLHRTGSVLSRTYNRLNNKYHEGKK